MLHEERGSQENKQHEKIWGSKRTSLVTRSIPHITGAHRIRGAGPPHGKRHQRSLASLAPKVLLVTRIQVTPLASFTIQVKILTLKWSVKNFFFDYQRSKRYPFEPCLYVTFPFRPLWTIHRLLFDHITCNLHFFHLNFRKMEIVFLLIQWLLFSSRRSPIVAFANVIHKTALIRRCTIVFDFQKCYIFYKIQLFWRNEKCT